MMPCWHHTKSIHVQIARNSLYHTHMVFTMNIKEQGHINFEYWTSGAIWWSDADGTNWGFCSGAGTTWQSDGSEFCPLTHIVIVIMLLLKCYCLKFNITGLM